MSRIGSLCNVAASALPLSEVQRIRGRIRRDISLAGEVMWDTVLASVPKAADPVVGR